MGFLSFRMGYYARELKELEAGSGEEADVLRAKRLLKMAEDLLDEGYPDFPERLESSLRGLSRLRTWLAERGETPFPLPPKGPAEEALPWSREEQDLEAALTELQVRAEKVPPVPEDAFLRRLLDFCRWLGREPDTAYLFLLRDTLLPCLRFLRRGPSGVYPWLLGRRTVEALAGEPFADDAFRACIYRALESGEAGDFNLFRAAVGREMRVALSRYPALERFLRQGLARIPEPRILVVEAGCAGTFPLLLAALDRRVEVRMYTTYPYLRKTYGERIFTARYEDNRLFETLAAQDRYLRFAGVRNDRVLVRTCADPAVAREALREARFFQTAPDAP